jgi:toxin ParE1/3/4
MRVIIQEAAYEDLDRIYAWIAKDRPRAADAVIARILRSAQRLSRFPYLGYPGQVPSTYEWIYRVFRTSSCTRFGKMMRW